MQTSGSAEARIDRNFPDWLERGVLVYGPKKGGTTLFQNLLDGSESLLVYPTELKLNRFIRKSEKMGSIVSYLDNSWVPGVETDLLSKPRYLELWSQAIQRQELHGLAEFTRFDAYAVSRSRNSGAEQYKLWCAKEVGGETDKVLDAWRRMYPEGKTILVVREPVMVTRALLNDRRRKGIRPSLRKIVEYTLDPLRVVKLEARRARAEDVLVVAYEDVVGNTAAAMTRVARFLGIAYDPVFERPTLFGEAVVVRTSSRTSTEVFDQVASWRAGLTLREKLVVAVTRSLARLLPRYRLDYRALRRRIAAAQGEAA